MINISLAIRETLNSRVDLAVCAKAMTREIIIRVARSVKESPYLIEAEKSDLLKRLKSVKNGSK